MPPPAKRWASRSRSRALRSPTQNSPSSAASIQPTGPAYQPRSIPSSSSISGAAAGQGSPPTAGVGCSSPASSIAERGSASWAMDRGRQVLDVGDLDDPRLGRRPRPRPRAAAASRTIRRTTISCSRAVLVAAQQLLAEVVVDRRVGAAPGRAGERDGRDAGARAPHQQLRAGADEGRLRRPAAEAEAGREQLAQGAEERRPGRGPRAPRRGPRGRARPSHLAGGDPRPSPPRPRARSRSGAGRCAISRPRRSGAGRASAAAHRAGRRAGAERAPSGRLAVLPRLDERVDGQEGLARRCGRARARAGSSSAGGNEDQVGRGAAVVGEGEAAGPDRPGARRAGPRRRRRSRPARELERSSRRRRRTRPAARDGLVREPEAASAKLAVRLLPAEPAVARRAGSRRRPRTGSVDLDRGASR